jgi:UDP-2,3-diacylglucosamine pyrophosphatase LpxH
MRQFVSKQLRLGRVRLANEVVHTTADGRRLLVVHGDRYDAVMTQMPWLAHAGDIGYEALMWGGKKLNGFLRRFDLPEVPVSSQIKTAVKSAVQYLSGFDEQVMARCRADGLKGVICGHTHHAETRQIRLGIVSYNCGDWVESCTALGEDFNGRITILHAQLVARRGIGKALNGTIRHDPKQPRPERLPRVDEPMPAAPPPLVNVPAPPASKTLN